MNTDDIALIVRHIVADVIGIDPSDVRPDSRLLDLGAQSFEFLEIVFRLQKKFDITLHRSYQIPDLFTVDAYVRAVSEHQTSGVTLFDSAHHADD